MKPILNIKLFTLLLLAGVTGCNEQQKGMSQSNPQYFTTPEEAIKKAKADLMAVVQSNPGVAPGVSVKTLESAEAAPPVKQVVLDFDKLLASDSTSAFDALAKSEKSIVYPMISGGKVLTIVELYKSEKGWSVTSLGSKSTAQDLDIIKTVNGTDAAITIYEVPNLQLKVYGVRKNGTEQFFINYDKFSLRQGVSAAQLLPVLKAAAAEFNRNFGDSIKKQRLVR
jgi:hypothetical protein